MGSTRLIALLFYGQPWSLDLVSEKDSPRSFDDTFSIIDPEVRRWRKRRVNEVSPRFYSCLTRKPRDCASTNIQRKKSTAKIK